MGTVIESVASASGRGSVSSAVSAARSALRRAHRRADEVGLLIHCGVYPDGFVVEPANAAFVQRRIGANLRGDGGASTLSFDLNAGGCGFPAAIEVAEGFLGAGDVDCALVVASDVDPARGRSQAFSFTTAGAAIVLSRGAQDAGFARHHSAAVPEFADRYSGRAEFQRPALAPEAGPSEGHYRVEIREKPDFAARGLECAEPVLETLLSECEPGARRFLVASPFPAGFGAGLLARFDGLLSSPPRKGSCGFHTAGIGVELEALWHSGRLEPGDRILFAALGGGLSVAASLYRVG